MPFKDAYELTTKISGIDLFFYLTDYYTNGRGKYNIGHM